MYFLPFLVFQIGVHLFSFSPEIVISKAFSKTRVINLIDYSSLSLLLLRPLYFFCRMFVPDQSSSHLSVVVLLVDIGASPEAQLGDTLISVLSRDVQNRYAQLVLVVYRHSPIHLQCTRSMRRNKQSGQQQGAEMRSTLLRLSAGQRRGASFARSWDKR